ncbi:MAG: hypothetical protein K0A95_10030, partial [Chromatiales bacterium]|nr:hypothetical protein [Chromatiales bacterium]
QIAPGDLVKSGSKCAFTTCKLRFFARNAFSRTRLSDNNSLLKGNRACLVGSHGHNIRKNAYRGLASKYLSDIVGFYRSRHYANGGIHV